MNKKEELYKLVIAGAKRKNLELEIGSAIVNRLDREIEMISEFDICEYFIVSHRIVTLCNYSNILRSPGRSSAGCSLVNYCLDITMINPLEYDLPFERFYNTRNTKIPDIDIDIEMGQKEELVKSLKSILNNFQICNIAYKPRNENNSPFKEIELMNYRYKINPTALVISSNNEIINKNIHNVFDTSFLIINEYSTSDYIATIKCNEYDIIELEYLKKIKKIMAITKDIPHPYSIDLNDESTYLTFSNGDIDNIFQFNVESMKNILTAFKPTSIIELASIYALFRPTSYHLIHQLIENKKHPSNIVKYSDSRINEIFKYTHGLLIFQETFIEIVSRIAKISYMDADIYWRALYKNKDTNKINEFTHNFILGCKMNSKLTNEEVISLEKNLRDSTPMSFTKAHAISHSMIGYWGAFYKTHFRKNFNSIFNGI